MNSKILGLLAGLMAANASNAAIVVTLGDQDFPNGQVLSGSAEFNGASAGEPAPFNSFNGSDPIGPNFSASWTFAFAPGSYDSGSLSFGIFDHDSSSSGSQLAYFGVDGVDLTSGMNALMESYGGGQREVNIYSLLLSASALAVMSDGMAQFLLTLKAPNDNVPDLSLGFNGAGLDFSTLGLDTGGAPSVPEPGTLALLGLGLAGLGLTRRRSTK